MSYDNEFELDLGEALRTQLPPRFDALSASALTDVGLRAAKIERSAQGAYALFYEDKLVYVGKSDAEEGLLKRLSRHCQRVQHRQGLDPNKLTFKAVRIYSFSVIDIETMLIAHFGMAKRESWNQSGFGSNDPGRKRDTQAPSKFDNWYPLGIDIPLVLKEYEGVREISLSHAIRILAAQLPYTFRAEGVRNPFHPELEACRVLPEKFFSGTPTIETMAQRIAEALRLRGTNGWQVTLLKGYCVMYKEVNEYKAQGPQRIIRS